MPIKGVWLNPAINRCYGKVPYTSWDKVERGAERASNRSGNLIIAYQCYDCGRFHIGHADKTQIALRKKALATINTDCPRCSKPVPVDRRWHAIESGNSVVYCSKTCRKHRKKKSLQGREPETWPPSQTI